MKPSGFTLIEILVVMAIFGILLALAAKPFGQMNQRNAIEKQVTEMYQEIVRAQQQAMQTRRRHVVTFAPNLLSIRRFDSEADLVGIPVLTKALPVAINTSAWAAPNATDIVIGTNGIMIDPIPKSICMQSTVGPRVDSLVIVQSQISLGQIINQGAGCGTPNILKK